MRIGIVHNNVNQAEFIARAVRGAELIPELLAPSASAELLANCQAVVLLTPLTDPESFIALIAMAKTGTPVLGVSSGASTLFISGLIPGVEDDRAVINLSSNAHTTSARVRVCLTNDFQRNAFTLQWAKEAVVALTLSNPNSAIQIPSGLLLELKSHGLGVLAYCDERGKIEATAAINPAGSVDNLAAISNKAGNVLAFLPDLDDADAASALFQSLHDYLKEGYFEPVPPLFYYPRR